MTSVYATENIPPTNVYKTATAALNTTETLMSISRITLNVVPKAIYTIWKIQNLSKEELFHT